MLVWSRLFSCHFAWCTALVVEVSIKGPLPTNITAPSGTTLMFTCEVNLTKLSQEVMFDRIAWFLNGKFLVDKVNQEQTTSSEVGQIRISTLSLLVSEPATAILQCSLDVRNKQNGKAVSDISRSENTTFTVYGMIHTRSVVEYI